MGPASPSDVQPVELDPRTSWKEVTVEPSRHTAPGRNDSGVPLGGIGAGKIEFCADGRFTNVTTNNNWDCPIIDGSARTPLMPRIKEGFAGSVLENAIRRQALFSAEGLPGAWLALYTPLDGAHVLKTTARPAFKTVAPSVIEYEGRFPRAHVVYKHLTGIHLSLDALGSFDMADASDQYQHSALPLALFILHVENTRADQLPVTLVFSWQNLNGVGGYAGTPINAPDPTAPVFRPADFGPGLWFGHAEASATDPRVLGDYSLRAWADDPTTAYTYFAGWDPWHNGQDIWDVLTAHGALNNTQASGTAGALAMRLALQPGASRTAVFALAWHMPHLLAAEHKWDHLVRASSAPPPPTSPNRRDYGHAYNQWFQDSWTVAEHGLQEWSNIRERVLAWQSALTDSSLPARFALALCNDLCPLVSNTWYTREGLYAMNEAPTDMNGCLGTLDQRAPGSAALAASFPALNRSELSLFAADQVREANDPRRFGTHWNTRTGRFELVLDRAGAILHDVGWDHLEGGRTGNATWLSAHWPELTSVFILQTYQYALWTGDAPWLERLYPSLQAALRFQARLDQDGDGVPDLWGPGSCTYDTELYPYYGAGSYVTGLYLAALKVGERLARERGDARFAEWAGAQFVKAQTVFETELWSEEYGYYISWRDKQARAWTGERTHAEASYNCHVSQLAGAWWADLLCLGDIIDAQRRTRALRAIFALNVAPVPGCPADECAPDGTYTQSMAAVSMTNFSAQAIAAGLPDLGWEAVERVYRVRYELDGSPWDAPLQWSGKGNVEPQWGRWYISHPSSWYVLLALGGVRLDRLSNTLSVVPHWPTTWGDTLTIPVFLPGFHAAVHSRRGSAGWEVTVQRTTIR